MKTFTFFRKNFWIGMLLVFGSATQTAFSQSGQELVFKNSYLLSGTAGQDGAKYVFPNVKSGIDAVLTISSRSDAAVTLDQLDETGTGFDNAFQPRIGKSGSVSANSNWWMEFDITFYETGYTTPPHKVQINSFKVTGLDIDGDNSGLREYSQMNEITSFATSGSTALQVTLLATLPVNPYSNQAEYNYKFLAPTTGFPGIDTTAVSVMVTSQYMYKKSITFRIGGQTGSGSVSSPSRQNSVWFKEFSLSTLPVKFASFTATLSNNSKADLKWTTASEINVSHFVIERSTDGTNYNDAGIVFAYGNATDKTDYSFSDNLNSLQPGIVYYRLRSVDVDGKSMYSETRIIRIAKQTENAINIVTFPNPVTSEVRISIPVDWQNKKVIYEVLNANGQVVKKSENASSSQTETVNMSNIARGFYIVKVSCEGQTAQQKIVKQ